MSLTFAEKPTLLSHSPELEHIQQCPDSPFGMLFLKVSMSTLQVSSPLFGKVTTQDTDETTNDGSSKLDPVYDEDDNDEEIPEKY